MTGYRLSDREYAGGNHTTRSRRLPSSLLSTSGSVTSVPPARRARTRGQILKLEIRHRLVPPAVKLQSRRRNLHEHGTEEMRAELRAGRRPSGGASALRTAPPRYVVCVGGRVTRRVGRHGVFRRSKPSSACVRRVDWASNRLLTANGRGMTATGVGRKQQPSAIASARPSVTFPHAGVADKGACRTPRSFRWTPQLIVPSR
jgi:hypothetical protein